MTQSLRVSFHCNTAGFKIADITTKRPLAVVFQVYSFIGKYLYIDMILYLSKPKGLNVARLLECR